MKPYLGLGRVVRFFCKRTEFFKGIGKLPKKGPAILIANHLGPDAPPKILANIFSLTGRAPYVIGMQGVSGPVGKELAFWWLRIIIKENKDKSKCLKTAVQVLKKGEMVLIFPEGKHSSSTEVQRGQTGAARLAYWTGAPIFPIGYYAESVNRTIGGILKGILGSLEKRRSRAKIGNPICVRKYSEFSRIPKSVLGETIETFMWEIQKIVKEISS